MLLSAGNNVSASWVSYFDVVSYLEYLTYLPEVKNIPQSNIHKTKKDIDIQKKRLLNMKKRLL